MKRFLLFLMLICVVFIGGVRALQQRRQSSQRLPSPSPMSGESISQLPFAEMTIPALRARSYDSTLGEKSTYESKPTYTSYLTSFRSDGYKINALLTEPTGPMPAGGWPAIVFVHGYIPPTLYQTTSRYIEYVDSLARSGYVVLKIDLRGHGKSEGTPGGAYYSSDYVIDTLSAYQALSTSELVNPKRIGLWGHSMAGNVLLRAAVVRPDIPAVAIWAGAGYTYSDLQTYRIQDASYRPPQVSASQSSRRAELFAKYGQFDPENEFWKQIVPTNYLDDNTSHFALFHANDDTVVSTAYTTGLQSIFDAKKISNEVHLYPRGGHNLSGNTFSQAMQATRLFYSKYL